jgi:glutathione S-transferase
VPILVNNRQTIWDSMAIMEYLADAFPNINLWPENIELRALARACAAEMHSGFVSLRSQFPMNCRLSCHKQPNEGTKKDLQRLADIWDKFTSNQVSKQKSEGPFLCGHFTIVDDMYAPLMWRVKGYGLDVSPAFTAWTKAMLALPAMQEWLSNAQQETWTVPQYDAMATAE